MSNELSDDESMEELNAAVRGDEKTLRMIRFYRPLSLDLQAFFSGLFSCEVKVDKPVYIRYEDTVEIPFPKEQGAIIADHSQHDKYLVCLSGLPKMDKDKAQKLRSDSFVGLADSLNKILNQNTQLVVTRLTDEAYMSVKWIDGVVMSFYTNNKKPFKLTIYPTSYAEQIISFKDMFQRHETIFLPYHSYNFEEPDKLSREQLIMLSLILQGLSQRISSMLSVLLGSTVLAHGVACNQIIAKDYLWRMDGKSFLGFIAMDPLEGTAMLEIQPSLSTALLNRLFGLPAENIEKWSELNDIELSVYRNVVENLLECLRESWNEIFAVHPRLVRIEEESHISRYLPNTEVIILFEIKIIIDGIEGKINLCLPFAMIEPILGILTSCYHDNNPPDILALPTGHKVDMSSMKFKRTVCFNCLSSAITTDSLLVWPQGKLLVNVDAPGCYEYTSSEIDNHCMKIQRNEKTLERSEKTDAFIHNFPLPFQLRFDEQEIDCCTYVKSRKEIPELSISSFIEKTGVLFLGNVKLGDVSLIADGQELCLKKVNQVQNITREIMEDYLLDCRFTVSLEIGVKFLPVDDVLALGIGSIIQFDSLAREPVAFFMESPRYLLGKGEAVVMEKKLFIKMTEVLSVPTEFVVNDAVLRNEPYIRVRFILAQTSVSLREICNLKTDSLLRLDVAPGACGTLVFENGVTVEAEVVVIGGNFGAKVIMKGNDKIDKVYNLTGVGLTEQRKKSSFDVVRCAEPFEILNCIRMEHTQTIAAILSLVDRKKAMTILKNLPPSVKRDVSKRIKKVGRISPMVISEVAGVVEKKLDFYRGSK